MYTEQLASHVQLERQMRQVQMTAAGVDPKEVEDPTAGEAAETPSGPAGHDAVLTELGMVIEN